MLSCLIMSDFCDIMHCSLPGSSVHGDSPGKNTEVGCHAILQGIFPTQRSNPGLLHCRSHQGSPRTLVWVTCPFSRRSSRPKNLTGVSCIAGDFFTSWATREAHISIISYHWILSLVLQSVCLHFQLLKQIKSSINMTVLPYAFRSHAYCLFLLFNCIGYYFQ